MKPTCGSERAPCDDETNEHDDNNNGHTNDTRFRRNPSDSNAMLQTNGDGLSLFRGCPSHVYYQHPPFPSHGHYPPNLHSSILHQNYSPNQHCHPPHPNFTIHRSISNHGSFFFQNTYHDPYSLPNETIYQDSRPYPSLFPDQSSSAYIHYHPSHPDTATNRSSSNSASLPPNTYHHGHHLQIQPSYQEPSAYQRYHQSRLDTTSSRSNSNYASLLPSTYHHGHHLQIQASHQEPVNSRTRDDSTK